MQAKVWLELPPDRSIAIEDTCAIGRGSGNHLVLDHEHVSRHHAVIRCGEDDACWLIDLGSANGTYVNDRRVSRLRLQDGDTIVIGTYSIRFRRGGLGLENVAAGTLLETVHEIRTIHAWLFLVDIEGSTATSRRLGALEMEAIHTAWLGRCEAVLRDTGGLLDKPLGDGFLAFWPAGEARASNVRTALQAFKRLQTEGDLPFRMALHLGTAFTGGEIASGVYRLFGADVVYTFRMEALAKALRLRCLLSARAQAALGVAATSVSTHALHGIEGPHEFFTL